MRPLIYWFATPLVEKRWCKHYYFCTGIRPYTIRSYADRYDVGGRDVSACLTTNYTIVENKKKFKKENTKTFEHCKRITDSEVRTETIHLAIVYRHFRRPYE